MTLEQKSIFAAGMATKQAYGTATFLSDINIDSLPDESLALLVAHAEHLQKSFSPFVEDAKRRDSAKPSPATDTP